MEYEIRPAGKLRFGFQEIWDFRELIYFFSWRDIKIKYKQTALGALWVIIQPLLLLSVFSVLISKALQIDTKGLPYPVFVFAGLLMWNLFSTGLSNAGNSMVANANIIKKIYFPRLIIPISSVLSSLVDFIITLILFSLVVSYYLGFSVLLRLWLVLPLSLLTTLLTTFGLGSFLAALNVKYRDFRYVIPFMIQILMFITPVLYPITLLPEGWLLDILQLNPLAGAIDSIRFALLGQQVPMLSILKDLGISIIFLLIGIIYFRKTEYYFADLA